MSLLYERCFQLYEGYKLQECALHVVSSLPSLAHTLQLGYRLDDRGSLSRMAHHGLLKINFNILPLLPMFNMQSCWCGGRSKENEHFVFDTSMKQNLVLLLAIVSLVQPIFPGDTLLISFALDLFHSPHEQQLE